MMFCKLNPLVNRMALFRGNEQVGSVAESPNGPLVSMFADMNSGVADLTFNEIEIIQDNWNALQEIRKGRT